MGLLRIENNSERLKGKSAMEKASGKNFKRGPWNFFIQIPFKALTLAIWISHFPEYRMFFCRSYREIQITYFTNKLFTKNEEF
jgi:hypothetical protein